MNIRLRSLVSAIPVLLVAAGLTAPAMASGSVNWNMDSLSDTTAQPGSTFKYFVEAKNDGANESPAVEIPAGTSLTFHAAIPQGFVPQEATLNGPGFEEVSPCEIAGGGITCPRTTGEFDGLYEMRITATVEAGAEGNRTAVFSVSEEGVTRATTVDPTRIRSVLPPFGFEGFDIAWLDEAGKRLSQAGAHPTRFGPSFDFNTATDPAPTGGVGSPIEPPRDIFVELPPGFVGNPTQVGQCNSRELDAPSGSDIFPEVICPPDSQIGTVRIRHNTAPRLLFPHSFGPFGLYNMVPPPGVAARFAFNVLHTVVVLDSTVRSNGDYGLTTGSRLLPQPFGLAGLRFEFWGVPASPTHDAQRYCPGGTPGCVNNDPETAFFRTPTSCTNPGEGITTSITSDSWTHPGNFASMSFTSHENPGLPYASGEWGDPIGFEGCEEVPFDPNLVGAPPAGAEAGEPTSLTFDLTMPQTGFLEPDAISESDLRKVVVELPKGVRLNPSSVDGLKSCAPNEIGLTTPIGQADPHFTNDGGACPEGSKIGDVQITTPLLDHKLFGAVYLAQPEQNPFGSMIALYFVVHDAVSGVNIKLASKVDLDPDTGQITATFDNNPQLPFENFHVELKSGPRAALSAPTACGTYSTESSFIGWSGATQHSSSPFTIDHGCQPQGFSPTLQAGTRNANAGSYSPLSVRLTRSDADQELSSVSATLPPGVSARLAGIPYCPETSILVATGLTQLGQAGGALASPGCPAASQIGTVTTGSGAGITPFFLTTGKVYLAGPYNGSPLSLFVEAPVVAGPLDLGVVTNRIGVNLNPETAQITAVTQPFPASLFGIPLQIRDLRMNIDHDSFAVNPTNCEPKATTATVRSTQNQTANLSDRFQVANCERLGFKPKLTFKLSGGVHRLGHPAFAATVTTRSGDANIGGVRVSLPPTEILDNAHIGSPCTRVQFAAGACPESSKLGFAQAVTPLLDQPLEGPVYLRTNPEHTLPDLVADLNGQIHVVLDGEIDSTNAGGLRNTFSVVPDAPVTKFTLTLAGGRRGLIQNQKDLCAHTYRASVQMDGQNGRSHDFNPALQVPCGKRGAKRARHRHH